MTVCIIWLSLLTVTRLIFEINNSLDLIQESDTSFSDPTAWLKIHVSTTNSPVKEISNSVSTTLTDPIIPIIMTKISIYQKLRNTCCNKISTSRISRMITTIIQGMITMAKNPKREPISKGFTKTRTILQIERKSRTTD